MKKNVIVLFLFISLICSVNLIVASAETIWNGEIATNFAGGKGTKEDPYQIKTAEQLAYLAETTNDGSAYGYYNKYFSLMNDIDLNNIEWTPIGGCLYSFSGFFDGNNHTIKNLKITEDKFDFLAEKNGDANRVVYIGLFGRTISSTIENLNVTGEININHNNEVYEDFLYVGGIAGKATNVINCTNYVSVFASSNSKGAEVFAGGISGDYISYANNCNNYGRIYSYSANSSRSGGISGRGVYDEEGIKNSGNFGEIKAECDLDGYGTSRAGGIASQITYSTIENCFNSGQINALQVGGIASFISESMINNCYNSGNTISEYYSNYGQLAYKVERSTLNNCFTTKSKLYISISKSTTKKYRMHSRT